MREAARRPRGACTAAPPQITSYNFADDDKSLLLPLRYGFGATAYWPGDKADLAVIFD